MFDLLTHLGPYGFEIGLGLAVVAAVLIINVPLEIRYRRGLARRAQVLRDFARDSGFAHAASAEIDGATEFPGVPGIAQEPRTMLNVCAGTVAGTPFRLFDAQELPTRRSRGKYYRHTHLMLRFPGAAFPEFELQPVPFRSKPAALDQQKQAAAPARRPRENELDVPEHPGFDDLYWLEHGHAATVRAAVPPALLDWLVRHPGWIVAAAGEWVRLERAGRFLGMCLPEPESLPAWLDGAAEIIGILSAAPRTD